MADRLAEDGYRDAGYEYVSIDVRNLSELLVFVDQDQTRYKIFIISRINKFVVSTIVVLTMFPQTRQSTGIARPSSVLCPT